FSSLHQRPCSFSKLIIVERPTPHVPRNQPIPPARSSSPASSPCRLTLFHHGIRALLVHMIPLGRPNAPPTDKPVVPAATTRRAGPATILFSLIQHSTSWGTAPAVVSKGLNNRPKMAR